MIKVGRFTAAFILICVGGLLLLDLSAGTSFTAAMLQWWPVIFIVLGIEYLLHNFWNRSGERQMKLDFRSLFLAMIVSIAVVCTTQASALSGRIFENFHIDGIPFSFSADAGHKFEKGITEIPLDENTNKVVVENPYGDVIVKSGDVSRIEIDATIWVNVADEEEAGKIAERSTIEFSEGSTLKITAKGEEYRRFGIKLKPKMNLVMTVPAGHEVDMELKLTNGKAEAESVPIKDELNVLTMNGSVKVSDIGGKVKIETMNGSIRVSTVGGDAKLETTNGSVSVNDVSGKADIETTNGSVEVNRVSGSVTAETTNGKITLHEVGGSIKAETTNGGITAESRTVGGDWKLTTTVGAIDITVPENGDYRVKGSVEFGKISTELPLNVSKKEVEGTVGSGKYVIEAETNGNLTIKTTRQSGQLAIEQ